MPSLKILVSSPHSPFQRKKFAIEKAATNLFQGVVATPIFLQNVRGHDFSKHRNRKEAGTEGPRTCLILFRNNHYKLAFWIIHNTVLGLVGLTCVETAGHIPSCPS